MEELIPAGSEQITIIERNFESKGLDYKGPVAWNSEDKKACCELTKDVMAMANTEGGYIVIGVSELNEGFQLEGVSSAQAKTFESSVIYRFIQNYVDPPINVRVQKISHKQKTFVVLEVPRFTDTPHICQKAYPDVLRERELYVRTDNNESAPIKSSSDFRTLIESAIRNRTDSLLSSFRAILSGTNATNLRAPAAEEEFQQQIDSARHQFDTRNPLKERNYSYFIETFFSLQEFDQYKFPPERLRRAADKAAIDFTGWPFLLVKDMFLSSTDVGLESLVQIKDLAGRDILDFWRLNESGLFYKKALQFNSNSDPPEASAPGITRHFAESIHCLTRLYEDLLDDPEVVSFCVTLLGTRGRSLVWHDTRSGFGDGPRANRPTISVNAAYTLAEWRAGIEDHSVKLAQDVFRDFQLRNPDTDRMRTQIRNLFARKL